MNRTTLFKIFLLSGLMFFMSSKIYAQNDNFLGSWVSDEPVEITIDDQSFILTGIDFLSANESPRYKGWLEEAVAYEELIDGEIRSGLNIFVYKINKKESVLTLKVIESQMGIDEGSLFKFSFEIKDEKLEIIYNNQDFVLKKDK
ncbi:hypothetical protein [Marivirga sp.]|uniref:hypothetical protein n=1 Tax=Marivirga sp. TaxID=2018662 RepID=UPI003DA70D7B